MAGRSGIVAERELPQGVITLLLADVEGSVRLWETIGSRAGSETESYRDLIAATVRDHGGVLPLEQGEGDAFVAAFVRASDALRCAVEIQQRLADEGAPIRPRMALHTGEIEVADGVSYMGPTINRCARMRDAGHGGQILVSRSTFDVVADALTDDLGFVDLGPHRLRDLALPEHLFQVVHPRVPRDFPALRALDAPRTNIPSAVTSFVGREAEIGEVSALIGGTRVVTLIGPGGAGKTRLALEVARRMVDGFADGVWLADLAPISDPGHVVGRVARAAGLREDAAAAATPERLAAHLESKDLMLIVDNCEHLVDASAAVVHALLERCGGVRIVATSREPLGVPGETAWRVPPLVVPDDDRADAADTDAVALFVERARQVRPNFELDAGNAPAIATICRRLDGLPLAIELAAARLRVLSPEKIADALADRFRLLSGGVRTAVRRQQTLRASLDWSYELLDDAEAAVLRRMAVFAGGFTLEGAEDVCSGDDVDRYEVLDVLTRLVDRSLVMVVDERQGRYRLLESVQEYAEEKLANSGEAEATRTKHRDHYLAVAERESPKLFAADAGVLDGLRTERENMRAALRWTDEHREDDVLLRLVAALGPVWDIAGPYKEAIGWIDLALERTSNADADVLMRAHLAATFVRMDMGDVAAAIEHATAGLELARACDDHTHEGRFLIAVGQSAMFTGDAETADRCLNEALAIGEQHGDGFTVVFAMQGLGNLAGFTERFAEAIELHHRGMERARQIGNTTWVDINSIFLAFDHFFIGRLREAGELFDHIYRHAELNRFVRGIERSIGAICDLCLGRYASAKARANEALAMARGELGSEQFEAFALMAHTNVTLNTDGPEAVDPLLVARSIELLEFTAGMFAVAALAGATEYEIARGNLDAAHEHAARTERQVAGSGLAWFAMRARLNTARVARFTGDVAHAATTAVEALVAQAQMGDVVGVVWSLELLASIASESGEHVDSARLWGAAQRVRDEIGYVMYPLHRVQYGPDIDRSKDALGSEAFAAAFAEGASMTIDEVVAYASKRRLERKRPPTGWASLSLIERRVVDLVAQGLTNPRIGERLFISKRTVQAHLARIFPKLGVTSRAQLAAEAAKVDA